MKDPAKLNTIFMGTSYFAAIVLENLISKGYNIVSVYSQPNKKTGRQQAVAKTAVYELAEKKGIPIYNPDKFNNEAVSNIKKQKPDLIIVASYGKILPKEILEIPPLGCINIHASLLPKYRGPSPIQNAILNGETETGTTIILINEGIDAGEIISQQKIPMEPDITYPELLKKMAKFSSFVLLETIPLWIDGKIIPQKQDENKAIYCQMIERRDGKVEWNNEAVSIYNRWRAFTPWPGLYTFWKKNGRNLRLKLDKIYISKVETDKNVSEGQVIELDGKIFVKTSDGLIILEDVQLEGKAKADIRSFINGYPDFIGSVLK